MPAGGHVSHSDSPILSGTLLCALTSSLQVALIILTSLLSRCCVLVCAGTCSSQSLCTWRYGQLTHTHSLTLTLTHTHSHSHSHSHLRTLSLRTLRRSSMQLHAAPLLCVCSPDLRSVPVCPYVCVLWVQDLVRALKSAFAARQAHKPSQPSNHDT